MPANLADVEDRARVVPTVAETLGPIDVLVNNAAAAVYQPLAEISLRRRRLTFELNLQAPIDLAQAVLPSMRERQRGWILNISSATSKHPPGPPFNPGFKLGFTTTIYGASKAALERFTTGLAAEVYGDRIAVNSLAPVVAVRTPGADTLVGDVLDANPAIVEPLELFVEAVCSPPPTRPPRPGGSATPARCSRSWDATTGSSTADHDPSCERVLGGRAGLPRRGEAGSAGHGQFGRAAAQRAGGVALQRRAGHDRHQRA